MTVDNFIDIYNASLNKRGEELCGDKVKYLKTGTKTTVVLSDGLGSGVKANILATLTTEILITMLNADVPLREVLKTVIGTLPICQVRKLLTPPLQFSGWIARPTTSRSSTSTIHPRSTATMATSCPWK
jgi:hypothetical protein